MLADALPRLVLGFASKFPWISSTSPLGYLWKWGLPSAELGLRAGASGVSYNVYDSVGTGFLDAWTFFLRNRGKPWLDGSLLAGVERPMLWLGRSLSIAARGASGTSMV
jgi:hypothetical protein